MQAKRLLAAQSGGSRRRAVVYRARMYDPELGRFMQTDPIGYADTMNLYQYCGNNPVNWIDPWGLKQTDKYMGKWRKTKRAVWSGVNEALRFTDAPWYRGTNTIANGTWQTGLGTIGMISGYPSGIVPFETGIGTIAWGTGQIFDAYSAKPVTQDWPDDFAGVIGYALNGKKGAEVARFVESLLPQPPTPEKVKKAKDILERLMKAVEMGYYTAEQLEDIIEKVTQITEGQKGKPIKLDQP